MTSSIQKVSFVLIVLLSAPGPAFSGIDVRKFKDACEAAIVRSAEDFSYRRGNLSERLSRLESDLSNAQRDTCTGSLKQSYESAIASETQRFISAYYVAATQAQPPENLNRFRQFLESIKNKENEFQLRGYEIIKAEVTNRDPCSPVANSIIEKLGEVRDQGDIGWCYAEVTADFYTFKTGLNVSASDIAIEHILNYKSEIENLVSTKDSNDYYPVDTGLEINAAEAIEKKGLCAAKDLTSNFRGTQLSEALKALDELAELKKQTPNQETLYVETCQRLGKLSILSQSLNVFNILDALRKETRAKILGAVRDIACKERVPAPKLNLRMSSVAFPTDALAQINRQLDKSEPVGIAYNSKKLFAPFAQEDKRAAKSHASMVVDRKRTGNQCSYLVRNSWGLTCPYGPHSKECDPPGYFWVSAEALGAVISQAVYMGDKNQ